MTDASRAFFHPPASLVVGAVCALVTSTATFAADLSSLPVKDGLLQFENVRVVNAPLAAQPSSAESRDNLRAFVNDDGTLRQPTPEEMQAMSQAGSASGSQARAARSSGPAVQSMVRTSGTRVMLDESQMQYSVVKRAVDGSIVEACVTGETEAAHLVHQHNDAASSARGQGETQ